jgi:hypothetical protein
MKKYIIICTVLVAAIVSNCGEGSGNAAGKSGVNPNKDGAGEIAFREYEHDFGKVTEGEKVAYIFTYENKGLADLVIKSASTSCGCTVPKFDKKPIPPGGNGNLEVIFDTSGRSGKQTKTITVRSNSSTPVVLLRITAEVETKLN